MVDVRPNLISKKNSPKYGTNAPIIAASTTWDCDIRATFPDLALWMPINSVTIVNNSSIDLDVFLNTKRAENARRVLSGTKRTFEGYSFSYLSMTNLSAITDTVAGEIYIEVGKIYD